MCCAGPHSALSSDDQEAFAVILPGEDLFATQFDFYLHVADLFRAALSTYHDVFFTQLALSSAEPGLDTTTLWHNVIKGLTDLGQYEDAYTALISAPHERLYVKALVLFASAADAGFFQEKGLHKSAALPDVRRKCRRQADGAQLRRTCRRSGGRARV